MSDIAELFARDPFSLTKEDLDQIVAHFRERRREYNLGGKGAVKAKPVVDLKELGLS